MRCFVYKSLKKADTYVYFAQRDQFAPLPEALRNALGSLSFVVDFDLDAPRKLAREDVAAVRANLQARGFHMQLPPAATDVVEWPESMPHALD